MTTVIISDARSITGEHLSHVYHYPDGCGNTPSKDIIECNEELALAFGRTLCSSCKKAAWKREQLNHFTTAADKVLAGGLQDLVDSLPDHLEVRIMGHGYNKQPITLWTSKPKVEEE